MNTALPFLRLSFLATIAILLAALPRATAQPALPAPPNTESVDEAARAEPKPGPERVVARRATSQLSSPPAPSPPAPAPPQLPREHHPWARFQAGAWRKIRITTESFDSNGRFLSRSETSQAETLQSVRPNEYELEVVSIVDIGGKRLRGAAQNVRHHLLCEHPPEGVTATRLDAANISLDGAAVPVERWSLQFGGEGQPHTEIVYYNPDRSPYVLRREQQSVSGEELLLSTLSVTRVDAPLLLDGGIVPSSHVTIVSQDGANQTQRFEVRCDAVPGGAISASVTERDASGRRVRWSTIELVAYGSSEDDKMPPWRWSPFRRLRERNP